MRGLRVAVGAKRCAIVGFGMIAAATTVVFTPERSAIAQTLEPGIAQAGQRSFDIPAQPLNEALVEFGRQAGMSASADAALTRNRRSAPVQGVMGWQQALSTLLAGSGLTFRVNGSIVTLEGVGRTTDALQLDPVQVQGTALPPQAEIGNLPRAYAGGEVARGGRVGVLGNRDYMDTPFSTTSYTSELIKDVQAKTVTDVFAVDPTIRPSYAQGSYRDDFFMRGFTLGTQDFSFNGLYGVSPLVSVNLAGIERVEVFRGPAALLNGMPARGAVGGTINLVPKRAPDEGVTQMTGRYAMNSQFGADVDFARRFGPNKELGLRVNASFTDGQTAISNNFDQLGALAIGLDFRSNDTRLDADFAYQDRVIKAPQGGATVAPGLLVPAAPSAQTNFYQPWTSYTQSDVYGDLRFEHDFLPNLTAYGKIGGRRSVAWSFFGFPRIVDTSGTTTTSISRSVFYSEALSAEAGVRARFDTGGIKHEAVVSGNMIRTQLAVPTGVTSPAITSNIYAPVTGLIPAGNQPTNATPTSEQVLQSVGVIDAMSFWDEAVQFIAGVRLQGIRVSNWSAATYLPTPGLSQTAVTPSLSLVVRPRKEVALYGNFIQALEQGPIAAAGLTNAGQVFPAFVSTQFEVGAKFDFGNIGGTLSAFQITRPSSFVNPTTNSLVVNGQQRNQGVEFTFFGEPIPGLRPIGGFSILNAVLTNTVNGTNNGNTAPGVPRFQANVGLDWDTPWIAGLSVGGRVIYTGATFLDPANLQPVPAWTRFDLNAQYKFERQDGKPVALRGQVINVGNNNYWMANNGFLSMGLPRTFMLSLTADF